MRPCRPTSFLLSPALVEPAAAEHELDSRDIQPLTDQALINEVISW